MLFYFGIFFAILILGYFFAILIFGIFFVLLNWDIYCFVNYETFFATTLILGFFWNIKFWNIFFPYYIGLFCNFRYEKYSLEGETRYSIAGFATVYQYYAYPANIRPRVSQVSCFKKRQEYFSH